MEPGLRLAPFCGAVIAVISASVLTGYVAQNPWLVNWGADAPAMRPITALCLASLGVLLIFLSRVPSYVVITGGALLCVVASVTIAEQATGAASSIFDGLTPDWVKAGGFSHVNRVSVSTAICLWLAGAGVMLRLWSPWGAPTAAILIGLTNLLALTGLPWLDGLQKSHPASFSLWFVAIGLYAGGRKGVPIVTLPVALAALVLSALLPALLLLEFQLRGMEQDRRAAIEQKTRDTAKQVVDLIERYVAERGAILEALAASPSLRTGDLGSFHDHIKGIAPDRDNVIVLSDRAQQVVLDTINPFGTRMPSVVDTETTERAFASGKREVSNLFKAPKSGDFVLSIVVPVAGTDYALRTTATSRSLSEQLQRIAPPGWVLTIVDRKGFIAARGRDPTRWVGQPLPAERWKGVSTQTAGTIRGVALDGRNSFGSFLRATTGWTGVAVIDEASIATAIARERTLESYSVLVLCVLGVLLAIMAAIAIARPLSRLSQAADAIKDGEVPDGTTTSIHEIDQVAKALHNAVAIRFAQEKALKEKRHLEALGRLAGGLAHDFNNVLTIVSGNLQLIDMATSNSAVHQMIAEASEATEAGARLNKRLMSFARNQELDPSPINLNSMVKSAMDLARRATGRNITVTSSLAAMPATVLVDVSGLESAIINLAINARDAMPSGGNLTIETGNCGVPEDLTAPAIDLKPGNYVRLVMRDTGSGMTEDVRTRVFDPFYTTKTPGQGNGLGLTTVHGFVKQSGGEIIISSKVGVGTEVVILLPLHIANSDTAERARGAVAKLG